MTPEEARALLYDSPKDQQLEPWLYDRIVEIAANGELEALNVNSFLRMRVNEFGEVVMGGGLADGDTAPTIRFTRADE